MADKPKSSIPEWQKSNASSENSSTGTAAAATTINSSADDNETEDRPALLDQAAKFLQDDSIRDAPLDRKRTFLESKGLRNDEIELLLSQSHEEFSTKEPSSNPEVANNHEAPSSSSSSSNAPPPHTSSSTATTTSPTPPPIASASTSTSTATSTPAPAPRDIPPIITYPEFLTTPATQPPLITLRSTLYTLYGAAGLATTFYAASEYLVKPMIAQLTAARHDLAETTTTNLRTLNTKLESVVSTIPPRDTTTTTPLANPTEDVDQDAESITSDPTELFHRDVAVQTSPSPLLEPTQPSLITTTTTTTTATDEETPAPSPLEKARSHTARMHTLTAHLRSLTDTAQSAAELDTALRAKLNDLHHYLDTYIYSKPGAGAMFNPMAGYGVFSTPGIESGNTTTAGNGNAGLGLGKGEEDAIATFRTEIRGVKGALLSARNFPAGGGRAG
ncbi:hypothetical protein BO86DRAFT_345519, partial [Aspergillus japonicus CBS 114.51]